MLKWIFVGLLFLSTSALAQQDEDTLKCTGDIHHYARVEERIRICTRLADAGVLHDDKIADFFYHRGVAWAELGARDLAQEDFLRAIKVKPNFAEAYAAQAIYGDTWSGDERTMLALDMAISLRPDYAEAFAMRGLMYARQFNYELALQNYSEAIKFNPFSAKAYLDRGDIYTIKNKYDLALSDYNQAIACNPRFALAYKNRGDLYAARQDPKSARADYDRAIEIDPGFNEAIKARDRLK